MNKIIKALVSIGSIGTIGFGVWHFSVPGQWGWYSYIVPEATELVLAIGVVNMFFSLCLVLIGSVNILFVYFSKDRFALIVMLAVSNILWAARCILQVLYPQGSMNPALQYGMLAAFLIIFALFFISLLLVLFQKTPGAKTGRD